jgi:hypothetical protein
MFTFGSTSTAVANIRKTRMRFVEAMFHSSIPNLTCMNFTEERAS